ncbi:trigger factor [Nodosilinea sp. LEGE 07088]|uniref:trigger factor n=1 Tax=Nodosilinea sp. LEGE 07088 TaxID=2777968 RepID=UPI0018809912|nr:trigger factor [Nodosilinea sp. LEGE 07088]MBE9135965.1 trigger factor [Nodosilinea sp. LEGE 07088]
MKVTQEVLPDSQVGLEIEVPADLSQKTYDQVLTKLMRTANIPGFRKGKVPRQVFLQRVGVSQFKATVLEELVQNAVDKAIKQEEIDAIGNYQLKSSFEDLVSQYEPGQPITIQASVDVPPRVTLKTYTGFSVQAEEILPDPNRVESTLGQYQNNMATLVPIEDRPAQAGDVAVIDFVGKVQSESGEFEEFQGGSGTDFQVELEEGRFIPGFVEGIIGMALDEAKDVEVPFPDDYTQAELAGKPAVFSITLKEIKEKELPDLDDEFAQEISEFETIAELQASLKERFDAEAAEKTKANKDAALIEALVEHLEAEIPNTLVQKEVDFLLTQTIMQLSRQGIDVNKMLTRELIDGMRQRTRPEAIDRLRRTLALGEVAKQEGIKIEASVLEEKIKEAMAEVEDPSQVDPDRLRQVLTEELLQEKILAWLEEANTIELVPEGTLQADEAEAALDPAAAVDAAAAAVETSAGADTVEVEATEVEATEVEEAEVEAAEAPAPTPKSKAKGNPSAEDS